MTPNRSKRHRAQAGTTLIELLVATLIMGLALVMLVGLFSTGVIDSTLARRDTAAQAATEYEMEKVGAKTYNDKAVGYSECFGSDGTSSPSEVAYGGSCPAVARIRADVSPSLLAGIVQGQQWTIVINTWPTSSPIGKPVSFYRVNR